MAAGIYLNDKEILYRANRVHIKLYNVIEKLFDKENRKLSPDEQVIMQAMDLCGYGWSFNLEDVLKNRPHALFLANLLKQALDYIQNSGHPFETETAELFNALYQEILNYSKILPEKAINMQITWYTDSYKVLLEMNCDLYEKFRKKLEPQIQSSSFIFPKRADTILETLVLGSYGFRVNLNNFLYTKQEILEFAKYVKQALEDIQKSNEPFDAETEKKINEFYQKLLTIAEQTNRGKQL